MRLLNFLHKFVTNITEKPACISTVQHRSGFAARRSGPPHSVSAPVAFGHPLPVPSPHLRLSAGRIAALCPSHAYHPRSHAAAAPQHRADQVSSWAGGRSRAAARSELVRQAARRRQEQVAPRQPARDLVPGGGRHLRAGDGRQTRWRASHHPQTRTQGAGTHTHTDTHGYGHGHTHGHGHIHAHGHTHGYGRRRQTQSRNTYT